MNKPNQPNPKQRQTNSNGQSGRGGLPAGRQGWRRFIPRRPIKRAVQELTAGGVVFRRQNKEVEILMIQDAKNRWTIPKGHVEKGEHPEQAALREVQEETNLDNVRILEHLGKNQFRYRREDNLILMTMHVFLMEAHGDTEKYKPENNEGIKDVAWFSIKEALEQIEYDNLSKLLLLALKKIRHAG